jgi:hypothetical protein
MQFNDLTTQQDRIKEKVDQNIQNVLKHGQYIMGPEVKDLEKQINMIMSESALTEDSIQYRRQYCTLNLISSQKKLS